MGAEITSQSLGVASELIVVMPIKKGFVDTRGTYSYASRIRYVLGALNAVRKISIEFSEFSTIAGPLERLQIIDVVRWSILENETRLMMAVSFKGAWEPYIRKIQQQAGKILDAVLCNCEGYADHHRSELGFAAFAQWVRLNQVRCEQYYSATPDLTIDDLQYLKELATLQRNYGDRAGFDLQAIRQTVNTPAAQAAPLAQANIAVYQRQWLQILNAFFTLQKFYPDQPGSFDGPFLRHLTRAVLGSDEPIYPLPASLETLFALPLRWIRKPDAVAQPLPLKSQQPQQPAQIQGGILHGYEIPTPAGAQLPTHGVLLLLRFCNDAGRAFLASIIPQITNAAMPTPAVTVNIALTCNGLRRLGLADDELQRFPREFRDGMEARAGLLGDVRGNHPRNWTLPHRLSAAADDKVQSIALSTVDCVLQLQGCFAAAPNAHLVWDATHPLHGIAAGLVNAAQLANNAVLPNNAAVLPNNNRAAVEILSAQLMRRHRDANGGYTGHFGFVDGISQPGYVGDGNGPQYPADQTALGDLLLGYQNAAGDAVNTAPLFYNSTFMALRKLRQNVGTFNLFVDKAGAASAMGGEQIKAKMMGRCPNGDAVLPAGASGNAFDYANDAGGQRCPLHAHVRRANPRTTGTPRIIRRGFSYGTRFQDCPSDADRGLFFMAYNASIADQFEVIQQWISGGNSTGLCSAESDPLLGLPEHSKPRTLRFIHDGNVERFDMNAPGPATQFVTLEWGMYLFVPSIGALKYLARAGGSDCKASAAAMAVSAANNPLLQKAQDTIDKLALLEKIQQAQPPQNPDERACVAWKALLEDASIRDSGLTEALWQRIREHYNGVLRTSYGVLIGKEQQVMTIFRDQGVRYSVREYWRRMRASIGEGFLGMDPQPTALCAGASEPAVQRDNEYRQAVPAGRYAQESSPANAAIAAISEEKAFELTLPLARSVISELRAAKKISGKFVLPIEFLCDAILARLSAIWFGIPDGKLIRGGTKDSDQSCCPSDFVSVGSYVFTPQPTGFAATFGKAAGAALIKNIDEFLAQTNAGSSQAVILRTLSQVIPDRSRLASTLAGLIQGFVTPTYGSVLAMMSVLIERKQLWHLQLDWINANPTEDTVFDVAKKILRTPMISAMRAQPVPGILHRTAVCTHDVDGTRINTGEKVVLGLASATRESPTGSMTEILFGGDYEAQGAAKTTHACPGKDMALGVMLGLLVAVIEVGDLQVEAPLVLSAA